MKSQCSGSPPDIQRVSRFRSIAIWLLNSAEDRKLETGKWGPEGQPQSTQEHRAAEPQPEKKRTDGDRKIERQKNGNRKVNRRGAKSSERQSRNRGNRKCNRGIRGIRGKQNAKCVWFH